MVPENFPLMLSTVVSNPRRLDNFNHAINLLNSTIQKDPPEIMNSDYKMIRNDLGRIFEQAWEDKVSRPFFYAGKFQEQPEGIQELHHSIMVIGFNSMNTTKNKI